MAKKLKYPKKGQRIKIPVEILEGMYKGEWQGFFLEKDGSTTEKAGMANHLSAESCWRCCRAYNGRLGFSDKKVEQIIKSFKDVKKEQKNKKGKKGKKNRSGAKSKKGKKK